MYELTTKPDFDKTAARFEAWWFGEIVDRLPINVSTYEMKPGIAFPQKEHASLRERWMDVEFQVERALAWAQSTIFVGDSYPCVHPNLGPDLTTTLFNAELEYGEDTSWVKHVVHSPEEWQPYLEMPFNFDNPYWQAMEDMTRLAIECSDHRLLVGQTDLHNSYDILAGLRSPQALCMDLYDCPDLIEQLADRAADAMIASLERSFALVEGTGMGSASWIPYYHQGRAYIPSCDFLALVSKRMGDRYILPMVRKEMSVLDRSIFHLDGPTSLQHLDSLLAIEELHGIQWVYGAGNGDADKWIDVYRRCLQHGKCLQVVCETQQAAVNCLRALGPRGVWLCVGEPFATALEAENFIRHLTEIASETESLYRTHPISDAA
jgi:hypothetical protein